MEDKVDLAITGAVSEGMEGIFHENEYASLRLTKLHEVLSAYELINQVLIVDSPKEAMSKFCTDLDMSTSHMAIESRPLATLQPDNFEVDTNCHANGVGECKTCGDCIMMEASGGVMEEDLAEKIHVATNLFQSATEMLEAKQFKLPNSNRNTFINSIGNIIDNGEEVSNRGVELRHCACEWRERNGWILMFDILAVMMEIIHAHKEVCEQLHLEQDGGIHVRTEDMVKIHLA
ncbi:hypothetical protein INT44_008114 [Umbelopsis vinacea]|uniref:Uncharacterized protein n=1 Tax=Umbelopsis vinacea TaxID=44442 RepID=A0A8H7PP17_9FUNG|nr:hypothetical protein INT44_008114 [Umbelopsis vinacea]